MNCWGTIKLIHNECVIDVKIYCSREDREEIIGKWSNLKERIFSNCALQIIPYTNTKLTNMNAKDRERWLKRLQKESKIRYGFCEPERKVDYKKVKVFAEQKKPLQRPPAIYDNTTPYGIAKSNP